MSEPRYGIGMRVRDTRSGRIGTVVDRWPNAYSEGYSYLVKFDVTRTWPLTERVLAPAFIPGQRHLYVAARDGQVVPA